MPNEALSSSIPENLWIARACAASVVVGGCVSALGWIVNAPRLTDWQDGGVSIKFNTAVCLVVIGLGSLFATYQPRFHVFVRIAGLLVLAVAGITMLQTILGVDLGIDTMFFHESPGAPATISPGRMGYPASISFMLLSAALILATFPLRRRFAAILSVLALCIAAPSLAGYIYGADQLYMIPRVTGIAMQTAIMLAVLAVSIAAALPEHGLAAAILRRDGGGILLRRSLPIVIIFAFTMSWVLLQARLHGYFDSAFNAAIRTVIEMVSLTAVLWWTAQRVTEAQKASTDALRAKAEIETQRRIVEAQETERARLSRDLHDQVGQEVTGLRYALAKLCDEDIEQLQLVNGVKMVCQKVEKLDAEISNLAWRMRPAVLETDGILIGLRRLGEECSAIHAINFDLQASDRLPQLPSEIETNVYRIVQESMNNVVKHAGASVVGVTLDYVNSELRVTIEDDGHGFSEETPSIHDTDTGGLGLIGMRERAAIVGGTLDIETAPGSGTTILLRIPLAK